MRRHCAWHPQFILSLRDNPAALRRAAPKGSIAKRSNGLSGAAVSKAARRRSSLILARLAPPMRRFDGAGIDGMLRGVPCRKKGQAVAVTGRLPTLIVGGGIGGLATALALSRSGRPVHVVEKAADFGEIGAGLQLAPNAMAVLDRLGLARAVAAHAVYPSRLVWMDALAGERITALDLGDACRQEKRITLEADREIVAVEDLGDAARARGADGSVYEAELLVGADGLHSLVRRLVSDDALVYDGLVAYRGTIPIDRMSVHAGLDNVVMWVG